MPSTSSATDEVEGPASSDVSAGPQTAPSSDGAGPARARRKWTPSVAALAVTLAVVLAGGGLLVGYLLHTTSAWQSSSKQWQQLAQRTGDRLGDAQDELTTARADLATTTEQLTTAQDRITELADEKARLGDDSAGEKQLTDYQARVSAAAGAVATPHAPSIDRQKTLIGYLENSADYDPADLKRYKKDVDDMCAQASEANEALQSELGP